MNLRSAVLSDRIVNLPGITPTQKRILQALLDSDWGLSPGELARILYGRDGYHEREAIMNHIFHIRQAGWEVGRVSVYRVPWSLARWLETSERERRVG